MKYDVVGCEFKHYLVGLIQCLVCRVKLQKFQLGGMVIYQEPLSSQKLFPQWQCK
jgi:hypothetical protein